MQVHFYSKSSGKSDILEYLEELPKKENVEGFKIISILKSDGLEGLKFLDTRQLKKKLWEIKFYYHNRIMYVIEDADNIYLLHVCKKQKGKAEKFELEKAIRRAKELGEALKKEFV